MAYCTAAEVRTETGSDLESTDMADIISLADKEVDAYLAPYQLTGQATGPCSRASAKFAAAIVYLRRNDPSYGSMIRDLRKDAYMLLDQYTESLDTANRSKIGYCTIV
jgi:hypothetical protein